MGYGVADTGVDFEFVPPKEAHALLKSNKAIFVDSRDFDDFKISKVQTSYSFPANDIMFKQDKLDKSLVPRCKDLAAKGKLIIVLSDAGISGIQNRGHTSRCRHVAQYLHELGIERDSIRRLQGGLNAWKRSGLDGVLGDQRRYYAGQLITPEKEAEVARFAAAEAAAEAADAVTDEAPASAEDGTVAIGAAALESGMAALSLADAGTSAARPAGAAALAAAAPQSTSAPEDTTFDGAPMFVTAPTAYRVLKGEVYKKPSPDAEKIIKLDWAVDRIVRTTGQVFVGPGGGKWAELDPAAGEKQGWVYVEGPGFGPSTRKIISEYLAA